MHYKDNEIYFNSRKEMLAHKPWMHELLDTNLTPYQCCRCGIWFASADPSTDRGAIICGQCEKDITNRELY